MQFATVPCCCAECDIFTIAIVNTNSVIDDNFAVSLNGTAIGTINNNSNACTGRIFSEDAEVTDYTGMPVCGTYALESTIQISRDLLIDGTNTLSIAITQVNNHGNFGGVQIVCLKRISEAAIYEIQHTILDTTYGSMTTTTPQTFPFTWPVTGG